MNGPQDLCRKALGLVISTEAEIFYQDLWVKALISVIPTEVEIFYQDLHTKTLESAQHQPNSQIGTTLQ